MPIKTFSELKAKMVINEDGHKCKRAQDINKRVNANIKHEKHENVLFNKIYLRHKMDRIQSKNHNIKLYL